MNRMSERSLLGNRPVVAFIPITSVDRARSFYRDTLGLCLVEEEMPFALVFEAAGVMLRLAIVPSLTPAEWTVFGWQVDRIEETAAQLAAAGVVFSRYPQLEQDANGVWTAPGGAKVAWFKDPDGNVLSLSQHPQSH